MAVELAVQLAVAVALHQHLLIPSPGTHVLLPSTFTWGFHAQAAVETSADKASIPVIEATRAVIAELGTPFSDVQQWLAFHVQRHMLDEVRHWVSTCGLHDICLARS